MPEATCVGFVPRPVPSGSTSIVQRLRFPPSRSLVNASFLPSRDQVGSSSSDDSLVSLRTPLPSAFMTKMSVLPLSSPFTMRSLEKAIFVPSGDQAGLALRARLPGVRFVSSEPSAFITKMCASLAVCASRLLWKAIRAPSGENAGAESSEERLLVSRGTFPRFPLTEKMSWLPGVDRSLAKATCSAGGGAVSTGGGGGVSAGVTVTLPRIVAGWIEQRKRKVPAVPNVRVRVPACPEGRSGWPDGWSGIGAPFAKMKTLWKLPVMVQVTFWPAGMVTSAGAKTLAAVASTVASAEATAGTTARAARDEGGDQRRAE